MCLKSNLSALSKHTEGVGQALVEYTICWAVFVHSGCVEPRAWGYNLEACLLTAV